MTGALPLLVSDAVGPENDPVMVEPRRHSLRWIQAHDAIDGELRMIQNCLEAVKARNRPMKHWEVEAIRTIFEAHYKFVHCSENGVLAPALRQALADNAQHLGDYDGLCALLERIQSMIMADLESGSKIGGVLSEWKLYCAILRPYLMEEEKRKQPLLRAYLPPRTLSGSLAPKNLVQSASKVEIGSCIHFMTENKFRAEVLAQYRFPRAEWWLFFQGCLDAFRNKVMANAEALQTGMAPNIPVNCFLRCY